MVGSHNGLVRWETDANSKKAKGAMRTILRSINRTLLIDELQNLLGYLKSHRSVQVTENGAASRSAELAKRVELARGKLDDLRRIQRREKEIQARRRKIEKDNAKRG
jgi:hypothetical protein